MNHTMQKCMVWFLHPKKALCKHLPRLYVTDVYLVGTTGFQVKET